MRKKRGEMEAEREVDKWNQSNNKNNCFRKILFKAKKNISGN